MKRKNTNCIKIMKYFFLFIFFMNINFTTLSETETKKTKQRVKVVKKKNIDGKKIVKKKNVKNVKNKKIVKKKNIDSKKIVKKRDIDNKKMVVPEVEPVKKPTIAELNRYLVKGLKLKKISNYDVKEEKYFFEDIYSKENVLISSLEDENEDEKIYVGNNQLGTYLYENKDLKLAFFFSPEGASYLDQEREDNYGYEYRNNTKKELSIFKEESEDDDKKEIELSKGVGLEYKF